jgi:hypothetical protein
LADGSMHLVKQDEVRTIGKELGITFVGPDKQQNRTDVRPQWG